MSICGGEDQSSSDRKSGKRPFESKLKKRSTIEPWQALPILHFEPTTPFETIMVCERLNQLWISEVHREEIDWSILEAASIEISRLERLIASFFNGA